MTAPRKKQKAQGVPLWIVSFSDMITLLLAFFVLLQAFAKKRDPELFFVGQGSFRSNIQGFGIPGWLYGREWPYKNRHLAKKYPTDEGPLVPSRLRVIDPDDAKIRKAFQDIARVIETDAVEIRQRVVRVISTAVRFPPGSAALDGSARDELRRIASELKDTLRPGVHELHVVGLAAEGGPARGQWLLSARRALAAREVLSSTLDEAPTGSTWSVTAVGAGTGGRWSRTLGVLPETSYVVIAIMGAT